MQPRIVYILPSYQSFDYARACLLSLHAHSPFVTAVVVDDASPEWESNLGWWEGTGGPVCAYRFSESGGLTRSWNFGLSVAQEFRPDYVICGNNDVLLSPRWWQGLCHALDRGYAMAGPVSNAPGITAPYDLQHVRTYLPHYELSDDPLSIKNTAQYLRERYSDLVVESAVGGFFMMAKARTWLSHGYRNEMFFPALIRQLLSDKRNRTPTMTGQENWLRGHFRKTGLMSCIVPSSFIFHYRSVSRGARHAKGDSMRMANREAQLSRTIFRF
jgi:GT2 family glycosyltransferase